MELFSDDFISSYLDYKNLFDEEYNKNDLKVFIKESVSIKMMEKYGPDDLLQLFYHYKIRKEFQYKLKASCFVLFEDGETHPFAEVEFMQLDDYKEYKDFTV